MGCTLVLKCDVSKLEVRLARIFVTSYLRQRSVIVFTIDTLSLFAAYVLFCFVVCNWLK